MSIGHLLDKIESFKDFVYEDWQSQHEQDDIIKLIKKYPDYEELDSIIIIIMELKENRESLVKMVSTKQGNAASVAYFIETISDLSNELDDKLEIYIERITKEIAKRKLVACPWLRRDPYRFIVQKMAGYR